MFVAQHSPKVNIEDLSSKEKNLSSGVRLEKLRFQIFQRDVRKYPQFKAEFEKHVKLLCSSNQVAMFGFCLRFLFFSLLLEILLVTFLMSDLPALFVPCVSALFTPTPQAMPCNTCPASCLTVGITSFNSGVPIVFAYLNRCEPKPQPD